MGGILERMIRSTKRCLKKMVGKAKLTYEELLTVITEVELIINSRPLTYVSSMDLEEPLTPSHLIIGRRLLNLPDGLCYDQEQSYEVKDTAMVLTKRMKFLDDTLERFWKRWKQEYLLELCASHQLNKQGTMKQISVGDVIVVHDDAEKRGFWKMGHVSKLFPGRDDIVRGAEVRVFMGNKCKLLKQPVQRLYPLEVDCIVPINGESGESDVSVETTKSTKETDTHSNPLETGKEANLRPRRAVAFEARSKIVAQLHT